MLFGDLFFSILNHSWTASVVILFVLVARLMLKKAPKVFSYALWGIVLIRLISPFFLPADFSLIRINTKPITTDIFYAMIPAIDTGVEVIDRAVNSILPVATPQYSMNPIQGWTAIGEIIWSIGVCALLIHAIVSAVSLKIKLSGARLIRENVYESENVDVPFVFGVFMPKIYLPKGVGEPHLEYIIAHEQTHIKRHDPLVKVIGFLILSIHWFNPLIWLSFILCTRDMEGACDEAVIREFGEDIKADYSRALLSLSVSKKRIGVIPAAFSETDTKARVKNVLSLKKPALWVIVICVAIIAALCATLLSDPKEGMEAKRSDLMEVSERLMDRVDLSKVTLATFSIDLNGDKVEEICGVYGTPDRSQCYISVFERAGDGWIETHVIDKIPADSPIRINKYKNADGAMILSTSTTDPAKDGIAKYRAVYAKFDKTGDLEVFYPWIAHNVDTNEQVCYLSDDPNEPGVSREEFDDFTGHILAGFTKEPGSISFSVTISEGPVTEIGLCDDMIMTARFPSGWTVEDYKIYNGDKLIGTIFYDKYEPYEGDIDMEDYYKAVYKNLLVDDYTPIALGETGETALANVDAAGCILSYSDGMYLYVAIQFEENAVDDITRKDIARSLFLGYDIDPYNQ